VSKPLSATEIVIDAAAIHLRLSFVGPGFWKTNAPAYGSEGVPSGVPSPLGYLEVASPLGTFA
jgi:hypothetical protein